MVSVIVAFYRVDFRVLSRIFSLVERDGGRGAAVVGRTFLGGCGACPPENFKISEPSESGSEVSVSCDITDTFGGGGGNLPPPPPPSK